MADSTTGGLPVVKVDDLAPARQVYDDLLIPGEFQGDAVHFTGKQIKDYAAAGVKQYTQQAQQAAGSAAGSAQQAAGSAQEAAQSAQNAADSAGGAENAKGYIENMTVSAAALDPGEAAYAKKTQTGKSFHIEFGIPRGKMGEPGTPGMPEKDVLNAIESAIEEKKGKPCGIATLGENGTIPAEQRVLVDDLDKTKKYALGVEGGKLYFMEVS